jgi:formate hydrogenlyase subunit 6/NADH:ubiquinone oxidoreductase subunit I
MVDPLFRKGLLFKSKKKDDTRYYRVRHVLQLHDSTAVATDASREMLDLWKRFMVEEWADFSRKFEEKLPSSVMRVIPVNVSVDLNTQILAFDDVKSLIDAARNLAVTRCSCRAIDGACGKEVDVCIQVDRAADYAIERGTGRQVSKQETIEILKRCEEEGLVHVAENKKALGHVICNCCSDCCINWPSVRPDRGKFVAPSRYRAWVDPDECIGCDLCLDRCYFDAMSMDGDRELAVVDEQNCMGCGLCQVVCPTDAIVMQEARPAAFVPGN